MRWFLVFALAGCSVTPQLPYVAIHGEVDQAIRDGARAWAALGFRIDEGNDRSCARTWFETGDTDCTIDVLVSRVDLLREREGTNALADRADRLIGIDSRITDYYELLVIGAHEIGHIVLDTPEHTLGGVMGGSSWTLEAVDFELACASIGYGC